MTNLRLVFFCLLLASHSLVAAETGIYVNLGEASSTSSSGSGGTASVSLAVSGSDVIATYAWSASTVGHTGQSVEFASSTGIGNAGTDYFFYNSSTGGSGTFTLTNGAVGNRWFFIRAQAGTTTGGQYHTRDAWFHVTGLPYQFHFPGWTNESGVPAEIRITQGGSPIPGSSPVPLQPGENMPPGDYTVPGSGPVDIQIRYPSLENDGPAWFHVDPAPGSGTTSTTTVLPSNSGTPAPVTITQPDVPTSPVQPNTNKTIWITNTPGTDGVDAATYREGVDKIVGTLKTGSSTTIDLTPVTSRLDTTNTRLNDIKGLLDGPDVADHPPVDNSSPDLAYWKPKTTDRGKALGKLPVAPTLSTELTPSHTIHVGFQIPKLTGGSVTVNQTVDFNDDFYAGPIAIFRVIMKVLITLIFFIAGTNTVKSAFAGK